MRTRAIKFIGFVVALLCAGVLPGRASQSHEAATQEQRATFAAIGPVTRMPYGWRDFCGRRPDECNVPVLAPVDVQMTPQVWSDLVAVNRNANAAIEPMSNLEHWGTILDHWDYPVDGKGDCKIYALYKRKLLMQAGYPRQALLMTIVRDLNDQGHTILTVRTDHGDFVLDNLSEDVRPWNVTGYRYIKRQSQEDPNTWVSIEPPAGATVSMQ